MAYRLALVVLSIVVLGAVLGACGKEIGDACAVYTDCSPNGDRLCDQSSSGGYCTIYGCDYSTCPEEAACIRFFTGYFGNRTCDPTVSADACQPLDPPDPATGSHCCSEDELCGISGFCVPRSSEVRYCMRKCDSDGDCRDGYECRDFDKMVAHGGQPVLAPGVPVDAEHAPKFCAAATP